MPRAFRVKEEILQAFPDASITLSPKTGGFFDVVVDNVVIFSKTEKIGTKVESARNRRNRNAPTQNVFLTSCVTTLIFKERLVSLVALVIRFAYFLDTSVSYRRFKEAARTILEYPHSKIVFTLIFLWFFWSF